MTPTERDVEKAKEIGHLFIRYFLHDSEWALNRVAKSLVEERKEAVREFASAMTLKASKSITGHPAYIAGFKDGVREAKNETK